ncbi:hypothetical protein [Pseudomonas sp. PLMAX]|uniref:hypothetical protein n=1 Tax=Pseudomonas sp. PLMAX TaxID=2201998 RepID=UPI0038B9BB2C
MKVNRFTEAIRMLYYLRNALHRLCHNETFEMTTRLTWAFCWALLPLFLYTALIGKGPTTIESVIFFAIAYAAYMGFRLPVDKICWKSLRSNLGYSSAIFFTAWVARDITGDAQFTNEVIAFIEGNIGQLLYFGIVFVVLTGVFGFIFSFRPQPSEWEMAHGSRVSPDDQKFFGPWTRLEKNDSEVIAAHEAGHAVVLGLFQYTLPDLTVAMDTLVSGQPIGGYCAGPWKRGNFKTRSYSELEMIVLLAGVEAEELLLGERTSGATSDYRRWLEMAERFLATDLNSIFYIRPENDSQKAHNDLQLRTLKINQANMARKILEANIGVLQEIRDGILAKRKLKGQEVLDLLSKVVSVEGCPVISERTKALYIPKPTHEV